MRSFILKALLFGLVQLALLGVAWRQCPRSPDHYLAAAIDKRARLTTAPSPRLIFVGGSSVGFGFDSRVVEPSGYAPVNMGHNINFGLPFMLNQVAPHLRSGDLVVVAPEYPLLWGYQLDDELLTLIEHDLKSIQSLDLATCRRLTDSGLSWVSRKLRCALHQVSTETLILYSRRSFGPTGDFEAHRGRPRRNQDALPVRWPDLETLNIEPAIAALNRFAERCEHVDARCVFTFAPLRPEHYEQGRPVIAEVERRLSDTLKLPVIGDASQVIFVHEQFFEAGTHLTEQAARQRTQWLMQALGMGLGGTPSEPAP